MIVVSNNNFPNSLYLYRWRWGIETLFSCLKSRGFGLEDTHMTDPRKIEKFLFLLKSMGGKLEAFSEQD